MKAAGRASGLFCCAGALHNDRLENRTEAPTALKQLLPLIIVALCVAAPAARVHAQSSATCEGLGLRELTIGKPPSGLHASTVSGIDISGPDWMVDSLDVCAGPAVGEGVYPLTLERDVVLGVPTLVPGLVACLKVVAEGSGGQLDCDGGTPMDVRSTVNSNGPGVEGPVVLEAGLGGGGRPGEAVLFAGMDLQLLEGAASPDDCRDAVFDAPSPVAFTTANAEQIIDDALDFIGGQTRLQIEMSGEPFACADWATGEGPGTFVAPVPTLDMPIAGDAAAILKLGDAPLEPGPLCDVTVTHPAIRAAGATEHEQERYALLAGLADELAPDDPLLGELEVVLPVIDRWANGRERFWQPGEQTLNASGYLADFFDLKATPGSDYPPSPGAGSQVCPIWAMYRGRMLIQQAIQTAFILRDPTTRESYMGEGREALRIAADAFPDNRVLRMWLDEPIPWPADHPPDPAAPAWANLQREALGKLADILEFWIEHRQAPDGQLGGGWSDDVEMWRLFTPLLVGFEHAPYEASQRLLSEGIFELPRLAGGYTDILTDVEHSSEDTGDSITPMLHVDPLDPVWADRARRLAELLRDVWSGRNDRGFLQFQSVYFTSAGNSPDPAHACDTPYHTRAVQPALLLWQRTRDPALTALFTDWLDTWVDATATTDRGKPAGVVPAAIHWPTGEPAGPKPDWWSPGCAAQTDEGLYDWPSQVSPKLKSLVLAHWITGDGAYLEPLDSMADLRRAWLADPSVPSPTGSAAWAGRRMGGVLTESLAKLRFLSGDPRFDDLLERDASAYVHRRLTGDDTRLLQGLERLVSAFRINRASYTSEVRWTDRIFRFAGNYANYHTSPALPTPDVSVLYGMLTGDPGDALYLPLNAVRWRTHPRDLAVLVESTGPRHFEARLHHFGANEREMGAELLILDPGPYAWRLDCGDAGEQRGALVVDEAPPMIDFALPPGVECVLEVVVGVEIDVRPLGRFDGVFENGAGELPVAILGSATFDVSQVDPATAKFGPAAASAVEADGGTEAPRGLLARLRALFAELLREADVNADGEPDLTLRYRVAETGLVAGDVEACLRGELLDGTVFEGCGDVRVLPACGAGFEAALIVPVLTWGVSRSRRRRRGGGPGASQASSPSALATRSIRSATREL